MLNIEKYKDEIKNYIENGDDFQDTLCEIYCNNNQDATGDLDVLNWLCEEYKEPILDEEEKKYLSAVIKPFRNRTEVIAKLLDCGEKREYIAVGCNTIQDSFSLPSFEKGTMYKGMELNKEYTLEELGL